MLNVQPIKKKSNKKIIAGVALVLLVIAGAGVTSYFLFIRDSDTKVSPNVKADKTSNDDDKSKKLMRNPLQSTEIESLKTDQNHSENELSVKFDEINKETQVIRESNKDGETIN